jgi:hypothetical protein
LSSGVATSSPSTAEDRHRRRDHRIAVEQRGAEDAQRRHQPEDSRRGIGGAQGERRQRHDAALALVVGAGDEEDVLQRHRDRQRPEDQRQDPQHIFRGDRQRVMATKDFLHRVQRTGPDVAKDDAHRRQRGGRQTRLLAVRPDPADCCGAAISAKL